MTRDSIIHKIKALRAKASDAAATEAEAQAAAAIAAKLLIQHDIEESELSYEKLDAICSAYDSGHKPLPLVLRQCWQGIEKLTNTKSWKDNTDGSKLKFVGAVHDVEMALYLSEMIVGAATRAWFKVALERYSSTPLAKRKRINDSFIRGFGTHINSRLIEMANQRLDAQKTNSATGTSLVPVKNELIDKWFKGNDITLRKGRSQKFTLNEEGWNAGSAAGEKVNLNRPFSGAGQHGRIAQ